MGSCVESKILKMLVELRKFLLGYFLRSSLLRHKVKKSYRHVIGFCNREQKYNKYFCSCCVDSNSKFSGFLAHIGSTPSLATPVHLGGWREEEEDEEGEEEINNGSTLKQDTRTL